ncbi:MAG: hypothetical protein H6710_08515 [Myxococcales bacterium]|nr:hypothetical protein [Myxococcales bacterium]
MAEAPLSLLIERGRLRLVADARLLAPGVRLRTLTLRPGDEEAPAAVLGEGKAGIRRVLGGPLVLEEAVLEARSQAAAEALAGRLRGRVIGGVEILGIDVEWVTAAAIDLQIRGRDPDRIAVRFGGRLPLITRGREVGIGPGQVWASPRAAADPAIWAGLRLAMAGAPGIRVEGATIWIDPLRLLVDRWLVGGGRRALRVGGGVGLGIEVADGVLEIRIGAAVLAHATKPEGSADTSPTLATAEAELAQAFAGGDAAMIASAAEALTSLAGRWRPEALAREIAGVGPSPGLLAALEFLAATGDRQALARLAALRGLLGDREGLAAMLARGWRVATHPVTRCRYRLAWALTQGAPGDGPAASRHALEALAAELGDGRWPAAVAGEVWSALALARAADVEIDPELAHAAAVEASIHLPVERAAEVLRRTAIELHERGAPAADALVRQTLRAADRLGGSADPELADRLRQVSEKMLG